MLSLPNGSILSISTPASSWTSIKAAGKSSADASGMSNVSGFECVECNRLYRPCDVSYVCPCCGGNLDVLYDYEHVVITLTKTALAGDRNYTMWRYRALLPVDDASAVPPLTTGWTPVYESTRLADR